MYQLLENIMLFASGATLFFLAIKFGGKKGKFSGVKGNWWAVMMGAVALICFALIHI
tara:strand:- start:159 stop:329 length:171 start_codon:yes stop_codon:yes gene_type:complete